MPSSATITAFYSFTANTKARASNVNTNFSNFRGHIIAIDPNTATAATTDTYDIGSTEYRWRTGYFRDIDIKSNTSTGQTLQIIGDTSAGSGAFNFHVGSTLPGQIGYDGFIGNMYGQFNKPVGPTTSASVGQMTRNQINTSTSIAYTTGATALPYSTTTIATLGRPVEVVLRPDNTATSQIYLFANTNTANFVTYSYIYLFRNGTIVDQRQICSDGQSIGSSFAFYFSEFRFFDSSAPSGTNTYHIGWRSGGSNAALGASFCSVYAKEI